MIVTEEPIIKAILPYFGGKRNLGEEIAAELGPHSAYWEPFCGSMAVLFAKEPSAFETVNDLYGELINLARVLADRKLAGELYDGIKRLLMHEELFTEAALRYRERGNVPATELPNVDRAFDCMICSWFGRNGVSGTRSYNQGFCVRYTKNGGHAAKRWYSAVESIPDWHERLRTVTILNRDALELIEKIEDAFGVVIYLDPPYLVKGCLYIHDADDKLPVVRRILGIAEGIPLPDFAWHRALAKLIHRFKKTRVVVSYYDHPLIDVMYAGWTKRSLKAMKAMVNQGMRDKGGTVEAPEILLINGPSLVERDGDLFSN